MKMIDKGNKMDDLYVLDSEKIVVQENFVVARTSINSVSNVFSLAVNNVNAHIWHHRLGHLSNKRLSLLQDQLHFNKNGLLLPCNICPLSKQRRLSFVSNNHLSAHSGGSRNSERGGGGGGRIR